jgi:hypothetical protein
LSQVPDSKTASRSSKRRQTTPPDCAASPKIPHSSSRATPGFVARADCFGQVKLCTAQLKGCRPDNGPQLEVKHEPVGLYLGTAYRLVGRSGGLAWPAAPQMGIQYRCSLDTTLPPMKPSALPSSSSPFSRNGANGLHVIMQYGLQAPAVPVEGDPGPVGIGDCGLIALVIAPTNAVAGF